MKTTKFNESFERFNKIESDNFSDYYNRIVKRSFVLEFRIRKSDDKVCIIQYFDDEYCIYECIFESLAFTL